VCDPAISPVLVGHQTHPDDTPDAELLLQFSGPSAHNLFVLHLRQTTPPVRAAAVIQLHLGWSDAFGQAGIRIRRVRRRKGRGEGFGKQGMPQIVNGSGVREEVGV